MLAICPELLIYARRVGLALLLAFVVFVTPAIAATELPSLGENSAFNIERETALGRSVYERILASGLVESNPILDRYINDLGYRLLAGVTVPIDARSVEINREGGVFAAFDGQVETEQIGDIQLASFINDKGLQSVGDNLFLETAASGPPSIGAPGQDGRGSFRQGYIEESSVDVVSEITELIEAQRGYELNSKVLSAADEMLSTTTRIR